MFTHTPDWHFLCFDQCEIILSHIPKPACGKDEKRIAAGQPQAGRTSICDVIVSHSQRIQDFLEAFFMFSKYKMLYLVVSKKENPLFV